MGCAFSNAVGDMTHQLSKKTAKILILDMIEWKNLVLSGCLTNSAGAASNGGGGGGGPEGISNGRGGGGVGGVGGAGGLMRGKRGSIAVAASESMNLCRVLYDYHLENSPYQITYKLPPAVEK